MKYFVTSKLSDNMHETPEGYLLCLSVPIARTGEMVYGAGETPIEAGEDGQVLINREAEQVFNPKTIASFEGKPVTIRHPEEFVNPSNWKELSVGILQNVRQGSGSSKDDLISDVLITDSIGIGLVKSGLREVSCGYEAEYTEVAKGRGIQTNIVGNHLALVEEGRAGASYAIHDHKGKGANNMSLKDKYKALLAKFNDEAEKLAQDEFPPKKEEEKSKDESAYDELLKVCNEMKAQLDAMKPMDEDKGKEESKPKDEDKEEQEKPKDEEVAPGLEDRLKALEMAVEKILEGMSGSSKDELEEMGDEDMPGDLVGDTAARAEILAPGLTATKDVKAKALAVFAATKEGKKVIDALNGSKALPKQADKIDHLFVSASEVVKAQRSTDLAGTKKVKDSGDSSRGPMTPERQNEINAKFYSQRN